MQKKSFLFKLADIDGLGGICLKKLFDCIENNAEFLSGRAVAIADELKIPVKIAKKIKEAAALSDSHYEKKLEIISKKDYKIYFYGEEGYPALLKEIHNPPPFLIAEGELKQTDYNAVAIVGTRRASEYGLRIAGDLARELAVRNITVVSGCAYGIDTAAHKGALSVGGRTIGVLGSGLERRYPEKNLKLMSEISRSGSLVSEFDLEEPPLPHNFPRRNRIISGISLGVVVAEAPSKSGALITANYALEQGREVFSVPGSVMSFRSKGTNELIKNGAVPVTDVEDILKELEMVFNREYLKMREEEFMENINEKSRSILNAIDEISASVDEIKNMTGYPVNEIVRELTVLEVMGKIKQTEGKRYIRVK